MKDKLKKNLSILLPFLGLIAVLAIIFIFILIKDPSKLGDFYSIYTLKLILKQSVIVGIGALGMTLVVISGGIDLSAGSVIALGSVIFATILKVGTDQDIAPAWLVFVALAVTIASCGFCGFVNGFLTAQFNMMPFIITLGTMKVTRGLAKLIANDERVRTPDNFYQDIQALYPEPSWLFVAPGVWIMIILTIGTALMLKYTVFGRYIYAIGSNEDTARLCGVNVKKYKILIYVLCGVLTGVAASMAYADLESGNPVTAIGLELNIIAAVVIGGASLNGGEGSALGSLIGALIMATLVNAFTTMLVPQAYQDIIIGAIIILAVGIDKLKHRKTA